MAVRTAIVSVLIKNCKNNLWYSMNSLWWLQIVWQMELNFSIIQTELGLSELKAYMGKKQTNKKQAIFFFLMWNKDYVELITNSLLAYCSYRMLCTGLDWILIISRALVLVSLLFLTMAKCSYLISLNVLKGSTPSCNTALLATTTQSEPKYCLLTFSGIDAGDCVQARHLKKKCFPFSFSYSHTFF